MRTDKITVFDLFEKQRRYIVPIFQRGYVWKKEDQWEPLWEDICDQAQLIQQNERVSRNTIRKLFLGTIVLSQIPTGIKPVPASEIIDGQQRLLTLQIFITAFKDAIADLDDENLKMQLRLLTANIGSFENSDEQFKVWPTFAYQQDIRNIMSAGSSQNLSALYPQKMYRKKLIPPIPALVESYFYYYGVISQFLSGDNDEEIYFENKNNPELLKVHANILFAAVMRYIQLVEIELDVEDDPQVIFETLNYRGVPLEPSDLIRNFIFLYASRQDKDIDSLYNQYWKDYDEVIGTSGKFWKEKERQGRLFRSRLDLFFFHYLTFRIGHEIKIGHLYQEFKDWWGNDEERSIETELEAAQRSSFIFRSLLTPDDSQRFGIFAQRLRTLDTTPVYPLLLWLCEQRSKLTAEEFDGILEDIESYIVRRAICRLTPKNYNRVFLNLLIKLSKEEAPKRELLQRELLALEGDSAVWPNNEIFNRNIIYEPLYDSLGPKRVRMILTALELASRTPRQEVMPLSINNSLTIEHVMPRGFKPEEWPYPAQDDDDESGQINIRMTLLHSIGNLTLLTQPLNSEISNGPFSVKRPRIAEQSLLILNSYFQRFSDNDIWNETNILERSEELAEKAIGIWKYPQI